MTNAASVLPSAAMGILADIVQVYRASRKAQDIAWNVWVARPLAAVVVALMRRTPLTPNQVTILGALIFLAVPALLIAWRDPFGLLAAALVLELAYVFDCADGQLARLTGKTSEVGAYFDFLIDEVKALLLFGGAAIRLWLDHDDPAWLLVGIGGCALVSIATSLTNFVRRREYTGHEITPGASARQPGMPPGLVAKALWLVQRAASFLVHYPSWFWILPLVALFTSVDATAWFVYLFGGVYALYTAKTGLGVVLKLGSPRYYDR